jgi:hypothetical protein
MTRKGRTEKPEVSSSSSSSLRRDQAGEVEPEPEEVVLEEL